MPRSFLAILLASLISLVRSQVAQAQFPVGITVDQQAPTFAALVRQAKPTLVFNHHDMLWIARDSVGHHTFTFNRAYQLQPDKNPARWYLLESSDCLDTSNGFGLIYARDSVSNPTIISRDPTHGVIYQLIWPSSPLSGSGQFPNRPGRKDCCPGEYDRG